LAVVRDGVDAVIAYDASEDVAEANLEDGERSADEESGSLRFHTLRRRGTVTG
jgi:hypothetical protein